MRAARFTTRLVLVTMAGGFLMAAWPADAQCYTKCRTSFSDDYVTYAPPARRVYVATEPAAVYVERPICVERRVYVDRPVYMEQPIYVERPVYVAPRRHRSVHFGFHFGSGKHHWPHYKGRVWKSGHRRSHYRHFGFHKHRPGRRSGFRYAYGRRY